MITHQRQALRDYGLLVGLVALLFWGGIATLGCGEEDVPGGGLVEGQTGVRTDSAGGIVFDVAETQTSSAQYRVPRYATLSDGTTSELTWVAHQQDGRVVGPDPTDEDFVIVEIFKDESRKRCVLLNATYEVEGGTRGTVRAVQVFNE